MPSQSNGLQLAQDFYTLASASAISWGVAHQLPSYYLQGGPHPNVQGFFDPSSIQGFSGAFARAFGLIGEVVGKQVVQTTNGVADIMILGNAGAGNGTLAESTTWIGDPLAANTDYRHDVWFFDTAYSLSSAAFDAVALHEVVHSLGLRHSHENVGDVFDPNNSIYLNPRHDQSWKYSVMSYVTSPIFGAGGYGGASVFPTTLQLYDVWALQFIYGVDTNTRAGGGDIYGNGVVFEAGGNPKLATIWDAGGAGDTLDASSSASSAVLDLRQGEFSSIGSGNSFANPLENIAIAWRTVIENAIGTSAQDIIIGNIADNELHGGGGDDFVFGDGDAYYAEKGEAFRLAGVVFNPVDKLDRGENWVGDGGTIARPNNNNSGDDVIYGGAGNDAVYGGRGDDTLFGEDGDDRLVGGDGMDHLHGGSGSDHLIGGAGDDMLAGGAQRDWLEGGDGADNLEGGGGDDLVYGGDGSDTIVLDAGDDEIDGGAGFETLEVPGAATTGIVATLRAVAKPSPPEGGFEGGGGSGGGGGGASGTWTGPDVAPHLDADDWIEMVTASTGTDKLVGVERLLLSSHSDTITVTDLGTGSSNFAWELANLELAFGTADSPSYDDDMLDLSGAGRTVTASILGIPIRTGQAGVKVDLRDTEAQTVLYRNNWGEIPVVSWFTGNYYTESETKLKMSGANSVIGTEYDDILIGSRGTRINDESGNPRPGEGYSTLRGGGGNDFLAGAGWESHLFGGTGNDTFNLGSSTWVEDAGSSDRVTYGIPLFGGVKNWWMEGNIAYWAAFSSLTAAFPVIGSELLYTASFFIDQVTMKFARYKLDSEGNLLIDLWGQTAPSVIRDYHLDLDTGQASGGVVVFNSTAYSDSQPAGHSREGFLQYINLALKAGFGVGFGSMDPLVLDLDGDGFELSTEQNGTTYFELDGDGYAEHTGWIKGGDGFLVRDANGNGRIDSIAELFGAPGTSGFTALAAFDSNGDGKVDAADTGFTSLQVWRDANMDGISQASELRSLADLGIASINLSSTAPATRTMVGDNEIVRQGSFTRIDGSTGQIADVALAINETNTRYLGDTTVSAAAAALPELTGFGNVRNLRVAATQDAVLFGMIDAFVDLATNDLVALKSAAEAILYRWAGVDGVAATLLGTNGFDTRKLAFLETFSGYQLTPRENGVIDLDNIEQLEAAWANQLQGLTLRLVVQGPLADDFVSIHYDIQRDMMIANNATALADLLHTRLEALPADAVSAEAEWAAWAPLLGALSEGMIRSDANEVRADFLFAQLVRAMDGAAQPLSLAQLAEGLGIANIRVGSGASDMLARGSAEGTTVYFGGGGSDTLTGGGGQDVYVFGRSIGNATINDNEPNPAGDRIRFAFLDPADVAMTRDGSDLLITVKATAETVRVIGQFASVVPLGSDVLLSSNKGIEDIQFADGTIFEMPEIMAAVGEGTAGVDHMIGTMHSDVFLGRGSNDILEGGDDADLYVFNRGDGNDTIIDQQTTPLLRGADLIIFGDDIAPEDLVLTRTGANGENLSVGIAGDGGNILVQNQFGYTSLGYNAALALNSRIEMFAFRHYGEAWTNADIQRLLIETATTAGDDTTRGFGDDDRFAMSAGDDLLIGMDGADTYAWGAGAGNDVISEDALYIDVVVGLGGLSLTVRADAVQFSPDISLESLIFARPAAAPDLVITNADTSETLTIRNQFGGFQTGVLGAQWFDRVEWFEFANGSRLSWKDVALLTTTGGEGDDSLWGDVLADTMTGNAGDDTLSGLGGGDTYVFGLGDGHDTIRDDNTSLLGDGFVTIDPTADVLQLGAGITQADVSLVRQGTSVDLVIGANGDRVTLVGQNDYFHTGVFGALSYNRVEEVRFADGAVWTWEELNRRVIAQQTTAGNDLAEGFALADRFEASAGNDILRGGDSGDTYVFSFGSGHDRIEESVSNVLYGDEDIVLFGAPVLPEDVLVSRDGSDLILTLAGSGDTLTIAGQFAYSAWFTWNDVELFRFANGVEWTALDLQVRLLTPTAGNDHLIGFDSADVLDGGAGDDVLEGGNGGDIYHFGRGSDHDTIIESLTNSNLGDGDELRFGPGVLPEDIAYARDGDDLVITIVDSGDTVRIAGQFSFGNWFAWNDIETFVFENGTTLSDIQVAARLLGGTAGDDHLIGTFRSDTLDGGAGNDILEGRDGSDIYIFGRGYGHDEIRESLTTVNLGEDDELRFGPAITLADLGFASSGNDLLITILDTGDTLKVTGQFNYGNWYTWQDVDRFLFDDGTALLRQDVQQIILSNARTAGDDHLVGFMTGDTLDGGLGNDLLEGGDGDDTYLFDRGGGQDVIQETVTTVNLGNNDTVRFGAGISRSDLTFARSGEDLILGIAGTTDTLTIKGEFGTAGDTTTYTWSDIEQFVFADGSVMTKEDMQVELLKGTAGNDHLVGFYTEDVLDGGAGDDLLEGGRGSDIYRHDVGGGHDVISDYVNYWGSPEDRLIFGEGIATGDVSVRRSTVNPDDMVLVVQGGASSVTLTHQISGGREWMLDFVEFADGTVWTSADLANLMTSGATTSGDDVIEGTSLADQLFGGAGNDTLRGLGGDDILDGGAGNDVLEGGDGADTYRYSLGGGHDVVSDYNYYWGSYAGIEFGAGLEGSQISWSRSASDANDIVMTFAGGGSITLDNQLYGGREWGVDLIAFADGTSWTDVEINSRFYASLTTSGNDVIEGSGRADPLAGGAGNDILRGYGGDDTLDGGAGDDILEGGDGADIYLYALGGGNDVVSDYNYYWGSYAELQLGAGIGTADVTFSRSTLDGNDIVLSFAGGGSVTLDNQLYGGQEWGVDLIRFADGSTWDVAAVDARFFVSQMTAGNDVIDGSGRGDTLVGAGGKDTLRGAGGNDRLDGGIGNDLLEGGEGDDVYVYAAGDGDDVLSEYTYYWGSYNELHLGAGLTTAEVGLSRSADGNDLILTFSQAGGSITLDNQFSGGREWGVDLVKFADGTQWDMATLNAAFFATQGTAAGETINGSVYADTINGRGGNDVLQGVQGNDTLIGGTGNDRLVGAEGDDIFLYNAGDGDDVINDYVGWYGSFDTLIFGAGISAGDIIASRVTSDTSHLRITFKNQAGSILIENQTWGDAGIERFEFSDGTVLDEASMNALLRGATNGADTINAPTAGGEVWALEGDDTVIGSSVADALFGQAGNDILAGGLGDDLLMGGAEDDQIFGGSRSVGGLVVIGSNLIVNGSFEQSGTITGSGSWGKANSTLPGWSKANSQAFEQANAANGVSPTDGVYWLDMDSGGGAGSNMDVSQTVADLTAGQVMRLQFDHANRAGASGGLEVYWNGTLVAAYGSEIGSTMVARQFDLVAAEGSNTLRFVGTGSTNNAGASLDNVRLFATQADAQDGGEDIAGFGGLSTDYAVSHLGNGVYEVLDLVAGRDGKDTLQSIDILRFADGDFDPELLSGIAASAPWDAGEMLGREQSGSWLQDRDNSLEYHFRAIDEFHLV